MVEVAVTEALVASEFDEPFEHVWSGSPYISSRSTRRVPGRRGHPPADAVDAMLASVDQYTGADPMSLLSIEAYLAASRDEQLREQIGGVVQGFRQRLGRWLGERGVPASDQTAAVLVAAIDGMLLHRGLGASPDAGSVAAVLRRLVS